MNKTFKRAVSSVLASAMAFSSVTVATVSTTLPLQLYRHLLLIQTLICHLLH